MTELRFTSGPSTSFEGIVHAARHATPLVEPLLRTAAVEQARFTSSVLPKDSGELARQVKGTVRRRPNGYLIRIAPGKGRMQVRRTGKRTSHESYDLFYGYFPEGGTGEQGPLHRRIPAAKRGRVPAGSGYRVPTGRGQAPQRRFDLARERYDRQVAPRLDRQVQDVLDDAVIAATNREAAKHR